ncbi:MAG: hypothetical protein RL699_1767 [Bacteroidota bacterium]
MRKLILIALIFSGCSSQQKASKCNENLVFKEIFFRHVNTIENIVDGKEDKGSFVESLKFISKYSTVSYNKIANYDFMYNNHESFEIDKERWLKWYADNRCNNIQLKE